MTQYLPGFKLLTSTVLNCGATAPLPFPWLRPCLRALWKCSLYLIKIQFRALRLDETRREIASLILWKQIKAFSQVTIRRRFTYFYKSLHKLT